MRNYIKKKTKHSIEPTALLVRFFASDFFAKNRKQILVALAFVLIMPLFICASHIFNKSIKMVEIPDIQLEGIPIAAASTKKSVINIPVGMKKANPFVPYREANSSSSIDDVPSYTLVEPPEVINENSDAARVMDTIVSGIMYDKYSPSAILNIEGNDYLVKKGDVVNNYKVLTIAQDSVTVKLGTNVYKAGIGEILTEGNLNHNEVSNLSNKFGGEKK